MATITEDFVSFETAKLLREKGFKEPTLAYAYGQDMVDYYSQPKVTDDYSVEAGRYPLPTLAMAMKWLREVYNKIIVPDIRVDDPSSGIINCYIVGIWYIPKNNGGAFCYTSPTPYNGYPSFEEACEAAIKYCLENLI